MKNTLTLLAALPPTPVAELLFWLILLCGGELPAVVAEQPAQGLLSVASYPSIQAALDANPGRMVYVPAGDHLISEKIRIHDDNGGLCGPGRVIQANADAPIIEIVKAAGVQIRDLTLTRAEGKMETRHEGLQAMQCRDLVLENLRVLDNHSSRSAIGLHGCEGGQVRGCLVRNYHRIAVDDRTKSAQYGYAFHCIAGFGIETEHGSGVLIQANRVIEHRLLHESLMMHLTPPPRVPGTPRRGFTPNGAYLEGDPVFEAGVSGMASIQNMLLQSWGGKIRVFRAMPAEWPEAVFHDLRAEGAFLVSAGWKNGRTDWIRIKSLAGEPCRVATDLAEGFELSSRQPDCAAKRTAPSLLEISLPKNGDVLLRRDAAVQPAVRPIPATDGVSNYYGVKQ